MEYFKKEIIEKLAKENPCSFKIERHPTEKMQIRIFDPYHLYEKCEYRTASGHSNYGFLMK